MIIMVIRFKFVAIHVKNQKGFFWVTSYFSSTFLFHFPNNS